MPAGSMNILQAVGLLSGIVLKLCCVTIACASLLAPPRKTTNYWKPLKNIWHEKDFIHRPGWHPDPGSPSHLPAGLFFQTGLLPGHVHLDEENC